MSDWVHDKPPSADDMPASKYWGPSCLLVAQDLSHPDPWTVFFVTPQTNEICSLSVRLEVHFETKKEAMEWVDQITDPAFGEIMP